MKDEIIYRAFSRHSKAVYANDVPLDDGILDSFSLGFASTEGGVAGEFTIECSLLFGKEVFKIKCYSDAISELLGFSDILAELKMFDEKENIADLIENKLLELNIADKTILKY